MVHGWEVKPMSMLLLSPMPSLDNKIKRLLIITVYFSTFFYLCKYRYTISFPYMLNNLSKCYLFSVNQLKLLDG